MTTKNSPVLYQEHRADLADLIIAKSRSIKQEKTNEIIYFFINQPLGRALTLAMLLLAFIAGFSSASNQSSNQQASMIEEIYYPDSKIL